MNLKDTSWLPKLGGVIAGLGGALSGRTSRQDNRSSEQVGAGPKAGAA